VRLATAHAKSRLSNVVQVEDAEAALKIMRFALYKDQAELSFEPIDEELSESENDDDDDDDNDDDDSSSRGNKRGKRKGSSKSKSKKDKQAKRQRLSSLESSSEEEEEEGVNEEEEEMGSASSSDEEPEVDESSDRFKRVQTVLKDVMRKKRVESINLQILLDTLKGETKADGSKSYSRREVEAILKLLETRNRLMYRDGEIMLV
jgi:DNA replicative helicase MCM subunit Mcm2 (Cdc46/Mcm family)